MRVGGGVSRNGRRAFPRDLGAISRHEIAISLIVSCQRGAPNMMCASYNRKRNSALGPALLWLQCRCSGTSLGWEDAQAARGRVLGRVGQVSERCRFGRFGVSCVSSALRHRSENSSRGAILQNMSRPLGRNSGTRTERAPIR